MREATPTKRRSFTILLGSHIATHATKAFCTQKYFSTEGPKVVKFHFIQSKLNWTTHNL